MSSRLLGTLLAAVVAGASASTPRAQYDCAGVSETSNVTLASVVIASTGLSFVLFVSAPPGDSNRIFIVERGGRIKIRKRGQPASTISTFLDISDKVNAGQDGELGLLGLAFDPSYASTRHFWVNYTETIGTQIYTVIARYTADPVNPDICDSGSEVRVLRFAQPETNHNGGMLLFGNDGLLYVFAGDGGGGGDVHGPCGNGQNRSVLLGKILRIDVRNADPTATAPDCGLAGANYEVPSSNPFHDGPGIGFCDEIWAYGLRNPWRASIDPPTGDLYVGDVGNNCWEEVDWAPGGSLGGQNYGWRQMEGVECYNNSQIFTCTPTGDVCAGSPPCGDPSLTLPVVSYGHQNGECSVTGGYVYRGCRMPNYRGRYFYGDFCASFVKSFVIAGGVATSQTDVTSEVDPLVWLQSGLSSFGVDGQGELYAIAFGGVILKIVPPFADLEVSAPGAAGVLRLSKTGDWTWEDLFFATDVPVSYYRVYRGAVNGSYTCVFRTTTPKWVGGGDPVNPASGQLFAYVVAAVNSSGLETRRGTTGNFNPATCP